MSCTLAGLKAQRISAGLSQDDLARQSNQSVYTIVQVELGGAIDEDQAQQIADTLGVSRATLQEADLS